MSFEKFLFSVNTHFIHFLLEYKDGYCAHYKDFIIYCPLDKLTVNFENLEYLLPNGPVRMFKYNLKMSLLAILQPLH